MFKQIATLLVLLFNKYHARQSDREAFMACQIKMLQKRLGNKKIIPSADERKELLSLGAKFNHQIDSIIEIVIPETYRRWQRKDNGDKPVGKAGRKLKHAEATELILKLKNENPAWGYLRIAGELTKLGYNINYSTIRRILIGRMETPPPGKRMVSPPTVPWGQFLEMHMESLIGCDFFRKKIWSWRGPLDAFVLVFIHLGSRRVFTSPPTLNPDDVWLRQQVRNASMWCQDEGIEPKYLIRDNDMILTKTSFDDGIKTLGARVIHTPISAPNANAFTESWIGGLKRECLDHFMCFTLGQLYRIVSIYQHFYNNHRPHQGKGKNNHILIKDFVPRVAGEIKCEAKLGGLLKHYYRDSA